MDEPKNLTTAIGAIRDDSGARVDAHDPPTLGYSPEWWERRDREVAQQRAQDAAASEAQRMIQRAGDLRDQGFPDRFVAGALGELADTRAMDQVRLFVLVPKRLLVLAGGVGVGKTTAATWVALKGQDPRPGFIRTGTLARRVFDKNLTEWLEDKTSLVIDDVGTEYLDGKGAFRSVVEEIVDTFYSERRTLVMTTNLRPRRLPDANGRTDPNEQEQFFERYGERVWSRLSEAGVWGECGTRDLRREALP